MHTVADDFGQSYLFTMSNRGDGTFTVALTTVLSSLISASNAVALGDVNNDGVLDIVFGGETSGNTKYDANVFLGNTTAGLGALAPFSVRSVADARQARTAIEKQLERLSVQKATLGSFLGRLDVAARNVETESLAKSEAESRIRDADVAVEVADLVRAQILQRVSASLLSQSSLDAKLVLKLIQH